MVEGALGIGPDPRDQRAAERHAARVEEVAVILASGDWTRAEVVEAARALARSPELDDKVRFGRTLTAADFERMRRGDERDVSDEDGERTITTLSGYALKVRRQRLMTYAEMLALWNATGGQVGPWHTTDDFAEAIKVEGEDKPRWRLRG